MFYVGLVIDVLLRKWIFLDVEVSKVMDESRPLHGGETSTNATGLQFFTTKIKETTNDIIEDTTNVVYIIFNGMSF